MSLIKDLKGKPENSSNIVDFVSMILPNVKTKYIELFMKIFKGTIESKYSTQISEAKNMMVAMFPEKAEEIKQLSTYNIIVLSYMFDIIHETKIDIDMFNNFINYNERNLIEKNDLTTYQTYEEIHNQVLSSEFKLKEKDLEKQVVKIYEDENWLMLKPLVFESSVKYGYGTKWCTAMENDKSYFNNYSRDGILIYFINRVSGQKIAVYRKLFDGKNELKTPETTFWNETDKQIDSFSTGLPGFLLDELRKHFEQHPIPNKKVLELITNTNKNGFKPDFDGLVGKNITSDEPTDNSDDELSEMYNEVDSDESDPVVQDIDPRGGTNGHSLENSENRPSSIGQLLNRMR